MFIDDYDLLLINGKILVIPAIDLNLLEQIKTNNSIPVLPGMVLIGKRDSYFNNTEKFIEFLESKKLIIEKYIYPELGHDYPEGYQDDLISFLEKLKVR